MSEELENLIHPMDGLDTNQPGYHHRRGWNDAIRYVMDVQRASRPAPTVEPVAVKALDDINSMAVAETGFGTWAAKPHNVKWVRLIAGTPIENDLIVNMANAIRAALTGGEDAN